ncbi:MAG: hypothetical protein H7249_12495 [Chitinophagaceae bacterium]|nr:hypothetical protein [Oligoflexus sp.]
MKTRFILRLLTLTSWLPLVSCATSDEDKSAGSSASDSGDSSNEKGNATASNNAAGSNNASETMNGALDDESTASGNSASQDLLGDNQNENSNFDDDSDKELANSAGSKSTGNAAPNMNGFEDNIAANSFASDPTAGKSAGTNSNAVDAFKNTAIEGNAFTDPTAVTTPAPAMNAAPIIIAQTPTPEPVLRRAPAPLAVAVEPAAAPKAVKLASHDVDSTPATLHWVGFKINEPLKKLNLEIVTRGNPEYEIFEQSNRARQNEIVIRFYHTGLRKKLHWDVDSSEFRSPVAYIRMREKPAKGYVDLVITHRDAVEPLFYEHGGNFLLSYAIPERYLGSKAARAKAIKDSAVSLNSEVEKPLALPKKVVSALPTVGFPRYAAQFKDKPHLEPIRKFIGLSKPIELDKNGLPESFDKTKRLEKRTGQILSRTTFVGVAADDVGDDFADDVVDSPTAAKKGAPKDKNGKPAKPEKAPAPETSNFSDSAAPGSDPISDLPAAANDAGTSPLDDDLKNADNDAGSPNAFSDLDDKPAAAPAGAKTAKPKSKTTAANPLPPSGAEVDGAPMENLTTNAATTFDATPQPSGAGNRTAEMTKAQDVDPEASEGSGKKHHYSGKPIFMQFYNSPLSVVLKSFSSETGNNFVYPSDIGATVVDVDFNGVPWDEALKAILETHSLGLVRIGENVVRVDRISALTGYMQELEKATQFESRRVPTKVMVFRLNNAVAKDVASRVKELLAQDIAADPRIKASDDNRTNMIVVEAPESILAKTRAIIERLDLETPQVEITSRIVEVQKNQNNFFGVAWGNNLNFDPGRALGFGTLNFPNSASSAFSVDPGVSTSAASGTGRFRFGSLNKFLDLDLLLRLEEKKGTSNVLQSNRVLVLDGQKATVKAGSSQFFRPAAGGNVINPAPGAAPGGATAAAGLSEITFDLSLEVIPQVTALGNVIMKLVIQSDTPGDTTGEQLATKSTRNLETQMVRASGDTGVIGGIYDTKRTNTISGVPFLSDLPIIGALFRSTTSTESQTELLIMVTPTIISGPNDPKTDAQAALEKKQATIISQKKFNGEGKSL